MGLFVVGMTAKKPFYTQDTAVNDTIFSNRVGGVGRTSGGVTAGIAATEERATEKVVKGRDKATVEL